MNTDGNTAAINRHLAEREDYDRMQELLDAEKRVPELEDRIKELEAKLAEAVMLNAAMKSYLEGRPSNPPKSGVEKAALAKLKGESHE